MALRSQLKLDIKKISSALPGRFPKGAELLGHFSKQLNDYEKRVSGAVRNLDLKSREARERSRKRLDHFLSQLRKTRQEVEKKVTKLVNDEAKRINGGVNDLVKYLRKTANGDRSASAPVRTASYEAPASRTVSRPVRKTKKKASGKKAKTRRKRSR